MNSGHLLHSKGAKNMQEENRGDAEARFFKSRERKCALYLDFRSIGPSVFDRARRKVVLPGEGNAWAPVS